MIYFSKKENGFFNTEDHEYNLPADVVEIDRDSYNEIMFQHKENGLSISADNNGYPILIDKSIEKKEAENIAFLSSETRRTSDAIAILDDAIELEMSTDEEIAQHKELRKYRLMLSRVQNQQEWPLNPVWPECPEFFKPKE